MNDNRENTYYGVNFFEIMKSKYKSMGQYLFYIKSHGKYSHRENFLLGIVINLIRILHHYF